MKDYSYFKNLTPRQQLNDLIHKYAQANNMAYGDAWREFDKRWKARTGTALSWLKWQYNQANQTSMTIPAFLERIDKIEAALLIAHDMTGNFLLQSKDK
ncbi:MAG: hypothetical protein KKD92_14035 [Proteobacteria bacterium]|nr:hypothetical protein [Pseudomonadota bacterium]